MHEIRQRMIEFADNTRKDISNTISRKTPGWIFRAKF